MVGRYLARVAMKDTDSNPAESKEVFVVFELRIKNHNK